MADHEGSVGGSQADTSVQADSTVIKKTDSASNSVDVSELKSAPVSVIQAAPARTNGVHEEENGENPTNGVNHTEEQSQTKDEGNQEKANLDIQPPSEQLPAELLQEESGGLTTVASLIEQADEEDQEVPQVEDAEEPTPQKEDTPNLEPEANHSESPAEEETPEPATESQSESSAAEPQQVQEETPEAVESQEEPATSEEKTTEEEEQVTPSQVSQEEPTTEAPATTEQEEAAEAAVEPPQPQPSEKMEAPAARKSGRPPKPSAKKLESTEMEMEESVDAIAAELERTSAEGLDKKKSPKKDSGEGDADARKTTPQSGKKGRPKKKDLDEKVEHVTKLGNNMYFYTGPGGQDSPPPLHSDEEDIDDGDLIFGKKEKEESSARKSSRAGKGRNPRLEREDEEVNIPNKKKVNLNPGWLKQAAKKSMTPKNSPGAAGGAAVAKKRGKTPEAATDAEEVPAANEEIVKESAETASGYDSSADVASETSETNSVSSRKKRQSKVPEKPSTPPRDEDLPDFDPAKFKPGYVPEIVKKGDSEYMIVVGGVSDTGLCGKYWGDLTNLPSRRRSKPIEQFKAGNSPEGGNRRGSLCSTDSGDAASPQKKALKKTVDTSVSSKKQVTVPSASKTKPAAGDVKEPGTPSADQALTPGGESSEKKKRGRKRRSEMAPEEAKVKKPKAEKTKAKASEGEASSEKKRASVSPAKVNPDKITAATPRTAAAVSAALAAGVPAGQQRSVSCVADTSTQREVVVECFAPYDDHRWVNIGKERDGMSPDAVQYARALRPPYHLLSFLRIKGHSTKGMSCTDKNTMVFVVLEGEITVILHTTQFNAKKGDSFYIPPKNYYNLINQKAREAELSLIQFQYDGPLPTVNQHQGTPTQAGATTASQ